jgi:hypothetical protein
VVSTFENSKSSSILGDGVRMSTGWKCNTYISVWNSPHAVWYSGVFARVGTISLSSSSFGYEISPFFHL